MRRPSSWTTAAAALAVALWLVAADASARRPKLTEAMQRHLDWLAATSSFEADVEHTAQDQTLRGEILADLENQIFVYHHQSGGELPPGAFLRAIRAGSDEARTELTNDLDQPGVPTNEVGLPKFFEDLTTDLFLRGDTAIQTAKKLRWIAKNPTVVGASDLGEYGIRLPLRPDRVRLVGDQILKAFLIGVELGDQELPDEVVLWFGADGRFEASQGIDPGGDRSYLTLLSYTQINGPTDQIAALLDAGGAGAAPGDGTRPGRLTALADGASALDRVDLTLDPSELYLDSGPVWGASLALALVCLGLAVRVARARNARSEG
jgi:hypothetical protein